MDNLKNSSIILEVSEDDLYLFDQDEIIFHNLSIPQIMNLFSSLYAIGEEPDLTLYQWIKPEFDMYRNYQSYQTSTIYQIYAYTQNLLFQRIFSTIGDTYES